MATQKGRNWSSGDIVTAANLSSIERGVSEVAEEYTPTTWANGNTVTAAALNNIEQGIANAGDGGSSDFSTAQMAIIGGSLEVVETDARISYLNADKIKSGNFFSTGTYEVILYQGLLEVEIYPNVTATTGDASITPGDKSDFLTITGDCTITISDDVAEA